MKSPAAININLVPKDPFYQTGLGRFLQWALSAGRYIVIFTELVVIGSFVTRFTLDRQITDLNNEILQKEEQVKGYGTLEKDFRTIQARVEDYKQVAQDENLADIFPQLTAITPTDVFFEKISISPTQVVLSGSTLSRLSLSTLINNMQLSDTFKNVTINKIESPEESKPGYRFDIVAITNIEPVAKPVVQDTQSAEETSDE